MRSSFVLAALCALLASASLVAAGTRTTPQLPKDVKPTPAAAPSLGDYTPEALADQIHNLPGLAQQPAFNMFSGYLTVDESVGRKLFYWYVESVKSPSTDPLIWWSNGGPGCSGLLGFLTEHGPFRPQPAPATGLEPYPFAWNNLANVLYVEAPAGVGYSFSKDSSDYNTGDAKTAADNLRAIQQFLKRFPQLASNDFYISAESYGGHYVPTLAMSILKSGTLPNFKGFLLGNPLTDMDENTNWGQAGTLCGHSLASRPTCDSFTAHCLGASGPDGWCTIAQEAVVSEAGGLDAYGLDFPTCSQSAEQKRLLHHLYLERKMRPGFNGRFKAQLDAVAPSAYDPCMQGEETLYLNRADVRDALHVDPYVGQWAGCSNVVNYNQTDVNAHMEPIYQQLLAHGGLRMVIFSGDDDSVCATLGTQHWMYNLLPDVDSNWQTWYYDSGANGQQIGGYLTVFKAGISLATVHGAGHMVSTYQPERGLAVLEHFLSGKFTPSAEQLREQGEAEEAAAAVKPTHKKRSYRKH